jgi:hypothetical protein
MRTPITEPTSGPFPLTVTQVDNLFVVVTNQGNHYAKTFDPCAARLIAAAPEMLMALDGIIQWWAEMGGDFDVDDMPAELWDNAHAALKKARRRDPR